MADNMKLLAVFAHPDDETLGLGSTLARYAAEGVETSLICATRGERGWYDSEGSDPGLDAVGRIREAELNCAAGQLGIHEVCLLDYIDGDLDQANPEEIIGKLVSHIRRLRPQVVVTFGPDGAYGHPDHIAISQFAQGAIVCAADRNFVDAAIQAPHRVLKLYYMVDSQEVVDIWNEAFGGISMEIDGVRRNQVGWENWQITTRLENNAHIEKVQRAIFCHKSQMPGYSTIVEWPLDELARAFGIGCFYRVFSLVNGGRQTEADLFEGLR